MPPIPPPAAPKIYHIVHVDRLASIIEHDMLWCDTKVLNRNRPGTNIGINEIKKRRLNNPVRCHPGLNVGNCVPFYFCPRSVMLYLIHKANHPELTYRDGQDPIVHLEADLHETIAWAGQNQRRWAFTLSNAGSKYFEDRCNREQLSEIDWNAVQARDWRDCKDEKQAEFLVEQSFPWSLVRHVGVHKPETRDRATEAMRYAAHRPTVKIEPKWYY